MTTIAYDGRYIAVDTQVTSGATKVTGRKWFELKTHKHRLVVFGCGTFAHMAQAAKALGEGTELEKGDYSLLVWGDPDGIVEYDGSVPGVPLPVSLLKHYAVGSGDHAALTAMLLGLDAYRAVEMACKVDTSTGGPIDLFDTASGTFVSYAPPQSTSAPRKAKRKS